MCILILTTEHADFPLILLSNRDEYLRRPTAPAAWWTPGSSFETDGSLTRMPAAEPAQADAGSRPTRILSGRDMRHPAHGTWLGVTRQGRITVLTNFREASEDLYSASNQKPTLMANPVDERGEENANVGAARSRGEIPKAYLSDSRPPAEWAAEFIQDVSRGSSGPWGDMGGFSLFFAAPRNGMIGSGLDLGILSNRSRVSEDVVWLGETGHAARVTCALSNSHFGDRAWPKVVKGELLLAELVREAKDGKDLDWLIDRCFEILSTDTMPARKPDEPFATYSRQLRNSIFIPRIETELPDGPYGTEKQTLVLVDKKGKLTYVERTVWDNGGKAVPIPQGDRRFEFQIHIASSYILLQLSSKFHAPVWI